jgi:hypothetical protein
MSLHVGQPDYVRSNHDIGQMLSTKLSDIMRHGVTIDDTITDLGWNKSILDQFLTWINTQFHAGFTQVEILGYRTVNDLVERIC